jgi:signal transduction histidine kinase/CheY-like chemotaxis protein
MRKWQILLVDDEKDVHTITALVLKQKRWRNRRFKLTSAYSQAEAIEILKESSDFHVAVLDVVMEKDTSGLELCDFIRRNCPNSMRIILRTGQPGLAPEEEILNEYDIDYYLAKSDATPGKLYSIIRACIRSSQDISTLLAYGKQLQSFTRTLQNITSVSDLVVFMHEAMCFLELKHNASTVFNYNLANLNRSFITEDKERQVEGDEELQLAGAAMGLAHERKLALLEAHPGAELGLSPTSFVIPFETHEEQINEEAERNPPVLGSLVFELEPDNVSDKVKRDFLSDATLFIENWCIAFATLRLRERLAHEQLLRDQMYYERLESIATMVTGVAHELNTPLGVARTANSMVTELVATLLNDTPDDEEDKEELESDLKDACHLMTKNLDRAQRLIQSFKQLSASQLSDEQMIANLTTIVQDCLETMRPDLKKREIAAEVHADKGVDFRWNGYPGHLSQVIINLTQNTIRYAYDPGAEGKIDVYVSRPKNKEGFRIEFVDHGKGVDEKIRPRLFDAFVTSGRDKGGTGLGLAIVHNIVVNLLGGSITCESEIGKGTRFIIDLPEVVDVEETKQMSARKHSPSTVSNYPHREME